MHLRTTKLCSHSAFSKVADCRKSNEKKYGTETQLKQLSSRLCELSDLAVHLQNVPTARNDDIESWPAGTNIRRYVQINTQYLSVKVRIKICCRNESRWFERKNNVVFPIAQKRCIPAALSHNSERNWIIDSGASSHMTPIILFFRL